VQACDGFFVEVTLHNIAQAIVGQHMHGDNLKHWGFPVPGADVYAKELIVGDARDVLHFIVTTAPLQRTVRSFRHYINDVIAGREQ